VTDWYVPSWIQSAQAGTRTNPLLNQENAQPGDFRNLPRVQAALQNAYQDSMRQYMLDTPTQWDPSLFLDKTKQEQQAHPIWDPNSPYHQPTAADWANAWWGTARGGV
jgi:hypothetical protein